MTTVDARLAALEKSNRRLKLIMLVIGLAFAFCFLGGQATNPKTDLMGLQRLTIVDKYGRPRILMGVGDDGPFLSLNDSKSTARLALEAKDDIARVLVTNAGAKRAITLEASDAHPAAVGVMDQTARSKVLIGDSGVSIIGHDVPQVMLYSSGDRNTCGLKLVDQADKTMVVLGVMPSEGGLQPCLVMKSNGATVFTKP